MGWLFPLLMSDCNRVDFQATLQSIINQRGDAFNIVPGTAQYIECYTEAILIYNLRLQNNKLKNQFYPFTMTDFLSRWEAFLHIIPLPTDNIPTRQQRIASKMAQVGVTPTYHNVYNLLTLSLPEIFVGLFTNSVSDASVNASLPGGLSGTGLETCTDAPWYSILSEFYVEIQQPVWMSNSDFALQKAQIYPMLNTFLPAYTNFYIINSTFSDGYPGGIGGNTISIGLNSTSVVGSGHMAWTTPTNTANTPHSFLLRPGSIVKAFDDNGTWRRLIISSVTGPNTFTITTPTTFIMTNRPYVIQGFFTSCNPNLFPYPVSTAKSFGNGLG